MVKERQTHLLTKITIKYGKNDKIIEIFTINCSNFHSNLCLSHYRLLSKIVIFTAKFFSLIF